MKRREFIHLMGAAAATRPFAVRAQQTALPVLGLLSSTSAEGFPGAMGGFRRGLEEAGYREGVNVAVEYRWANDELDRLPGLAAELVARRVAVIAVIGGLPPAQAAKAATSTIPVVFATSADPVKADLVSSLSRPTGNLTGATTLNVQLGPKRLELLHEAIPTVTKVGLLVNPRTPLFAETLKREVEGAARDLGIGVHVLQASTEGYFETVFATMAQLGLGGLVVGPDTFFTTRSEELAALALRHRIPAIYQYREFAAGGGLMSFGGSITDQYRIAGLYTGRILKGAKPSDLPVVQSAKVELFINAKTARTLGVTFPRTLLGLADEVIE